MTYSAGVGPDDLFSMVASGEALASCVFRVDHMIVGELQIKVESLDSLHFDDRSHSWNVTKNLKGVVP